MTDDCTEEHLRALVEKSDYAQLRTGCKVTSRVELENTVKVKYSSRNGEEFSILCDFLVGADGKRGIVRKHFLEPVGIRQLPGLYDLAQRWTAPVLTAPQAQLRSQMGRRKPSDPSAYSEVTSRVSALGSWLHLYGCMGSLLATGLPVCLPS